MSTALKAQDYSYTYADYLEWDDNIRAELINGYVYMMAPPLTIHQRISMRLSLRIAQFLEGKTCEVFTAPFGVRLFPKEDRTDNTVVEPDIVVVCDPSKIDKRGCNGAPDLVIEITSPSNLRMDLFAKYNLYLEAKVPEYWLVYPDEKAIIVNILDGYIYHQFAYGVRDPEIKIDELTPEIIQVKALLGLEIDVKDIFRE